MKETKPYWYHNTAYLMEQHFVCLDFPNLIKVINCNHQKEMIRTIICLMTIINDSLTR